MGGVFTIVTRNSRGGGGPLGGVFTLVTRNCKGGEIHCVVDRKKETNKHTGKKVQADKRMDKY